MTQRWDIGYFPYGRHSSVSGSEERDDVLEMVQVDDRLVTRDEIDRIMQRMRWRGYIDKKYGIAYFAADIWGKHKRLVSFKSLQTMTPAQFWARLRKLDPYRVAQVERHIF